MAELAKATPMPPAPYRALWAVTDGLVREIVELHGPKPDVYTHMVKWRCEGCEAYGYDAEYPDWPCETSGLIAQHLGVSLRAEAYVVDGEVPSGLSRESNPASSERPAQ